MIAGGIGTVAAGAGKMIFDRAKSAVSNLVTTGDGNSSRRGSTADENQRLVPDGGGESGVGGGLSLFDWGDATDADLLAKHADKRDVELSQSDYNDLRRSLESSGSTTASPEDQVPRRFSVKIRSVSLEAPAVSESGKTQRALPLFLVFEIGGNAVETRVVDGRRAVPRVAGFFGHTVSTPCVSVPPGGVPTSVPVQSTLEWRGTYADLTRERIKMELWVSRPLTVNLFLGSVEEYLLSVANDAVARTVSFPNNFRLTFYLEFQEVFDFALNLCFLKLLPAFEAASGGSAASPPDLHASLLAAHKEALESAAGARARSSVASVGSDFSGALAAFSRFAGSGSSCSLEVRMPPQGLNKWSQKASCQLMGGADAAEFGCDYLGRLSYRGSSSDLEVAFAEVRVKSGSGEQLRGTLRFNTADAVPEFGLLLYDGAGAAVAALVGKCGCPSLPRYRQVGQILDVDPHRQYLFVRVCGVDRLRPRVSVGAADSFVEVAFNNESRRSLTVTKTLTPTYKSEMLFDLGGLKKDRLDPARLSSLAVDLWIAGPDDDDSTAATAQHLGWTELFLQDVVKAAAGSAGGGGGGAVGAAGGNAPLPPGGAPAAAAGVTAERRALHFWDKRARKDATYETTVFRVSRKLHCSWTTDTRQSSTLSLELWFKPDIPRPDGPPSPTPPPPYITPFAFPPELRRAVERCQRTWTTTLACFERSFPFFGVDHRSRKVPLNYFTTKVSPPSPAVRTALDAFALARCVALMQAPATGPLLTVAPPEIVAKCRAGSCLDIAVFLCSLFLGLNLRAFVALGSKSADEADDSYAWVITVGDGVGGAGGSGGAGATGVVKYWDPCVGLVHTLGDGENAPAGGGAAAGDDYPPLVTSAAPQYFSCTVLFHPENVYARLAPETLPVAAADFDFSAGTAGDAGSAKWLPFFTAAGAAGSPPISPRGGSPPGERRTFAFSKPLFSPPPDEATLTKYISNFEDALVETSHSRRFRISKAARSSWARGSPICALLRSGAELQSQRHLGSGAAPDFSAWSRAAQAVTPRGYRLRCVNFAAFQPSTLQPEAVAKRAVEETPFFNENESLRFAVGTVARGLPGGAVALFATLACLDLSAAVEP